MSKLHIIALQDTTHGIRQNSKYARNNILSYFVMFSNLVNFPSLLSLIISGLSPVPSLQIPTAQCANKSLHKTFSLSGSKLHWAAALWVSDQSQKLSWQFSYPLPKLNLPRPGSCLSISWSSFYPYDRWKSRMRAQCRPRLWSGSLWQIWSKPKGPPTSLKVKWNATKVDLVLENKEDNEIVQLKTIAVFFEKIDVVGLGQGNIKRIYDWECKRVC